MNIETLTEEQSKETTNQETVPSMKEFEEEISRSFKRIKEGDIITGNIIGISDNEVTIDIGSYTEGIIPLFELSNDPHFSIHTDIKVGDTISALVIGEDNKDGSILLSAKQANDILAWDKLKEYLENRTPLSVKIQQTVNGGVITYVNDIRAFIPASQLALSYVEDLESFVGKTVDAIIITVEKEKKKLVLSVKEIEKEHAQKKHQDKINNLQLGLVTTGVIEKVVPYGVFVNIGDGLSGLVHISQICGRHIKSPNEVVKLNDSVTVKIIDVKDGKISLSMKAVQEQEEVVDDVNKAPIEYTSGESASTALGSLLANIKLD